MQLVQGIPTCWGSCGCCILVAALISCSVHQMGQQQELCQHSMQLDGPATAVMPCLPCRPAAMHINHTAVMWCQCTACHSCSMPQIVSESKKARAGDQATHIGKRPASANELPSDATYPDKVVDQFCSTQLATSHMT